MSVSGHVTQRSDRSVQHDWQRCPKKTMQEDKVKENAGKQATYLSMMKEAMLRFQPRKLVFVGVGERRKMTEEVHVAEPFRFTNGRSDRVSGTPKKLFNVSAVLRLRTFAYLIAATVLFVVYINNLLTINALSRENERLRENIGISRSINAALELELQELHTIHKISGKAEQMGLKTRITPAVKISGE